MRVRGMSQWVKQCEDLSRNPCNPRGCWGQCICSHALLWRRDAHRLAGTEHVENNRDLSQTWLRVGSDTWSCPLVFTMQVRACTHVCISQLWKWNLVHHLSHSPRVTHLGLLPFSSHFLSPFKATVRRVFSPNWKTLSTAKNFCAGSKFVFPTFEMIVLEV